MWDFFRLPACEQDPWQPAWTWSKLQLPLSAFWWRDSHSRPARTADSLAALAASPVRRVLVTGRRGHVQAAFTIKELRELTRLELDEATEAEHAGNGDGDGDGNGGAPARALAGYRHVAPRAPRRLEVADLRDVVVVDVDRGRVANGSAAAAALRTRTRSPARRSWPWSCMSASTSTS